MSLPELLEELSRREIALWSDGARLQYRAPVGALTAELHSELGRFKPELLALVPGPIPESESRDRDLPLSFAQERLWFLDRFSPGNPSYNVCCAVRLHGDLDPQVLARSLREITRRHETLRSTFPSRAGVPVRVVHPDAEVELPLVDLRRVHTAEPELQAMAREEANRPFDLSAGPLLRARLLRCGDQEHVLVLTTHHIASDGWSMRVVLAREIAAIYDALSRREHHALPEPRRRYADFVRWHRGWLQGPALGVLLGYWKRQLTGAPALALPTDRPRPDIQAFRGARLTFALPPALSDAIEGLARREGATPFMTLLAAFKVLLARHTGLQDVVVGAPSANRRPETDNLIGFFVDNLVLRTDLSGEPSFVELLRRVRRVALEAYTYQDLPFGKLVEELRPERDLSRGSLIQVIFDLQRALPLPPCGDLELTEFDFDDGTVRFDLELHMWRGPEGFYGFFQYDRDLFDEETISRMQGQFAALLAGVVADPESPISRLPILTTREREQVLRSSRGQIRSEFLRPTSLHELIEAQVRRTPESVAVDFEGLTLSYRELDARATQLAHRLRDLGIGRDRPVGVCMERSLALVVALLASMKAGGAYLPLDPEYPAERLAYMLADSRVSLVLAQAGLEDRVPGSSARVAVLDAPAQHLDGVALSDVDSATPLPHVSPDDLAYVIYTSGSTGRPKGVMNVHRAICNRLLWMQDAFRLTAEDRVLQKTPFSFDVSVWEFFWPLLTGARLVVARPGGHRDPAYLADVIVRERITTIHFVPSLLRTFLDQSGHDAKRLVSLRRVICSGEALAPALAQRFFASSPAELHNLYGPTEAAVDVTWWECGRDGQGKTIPIGRPIANVACYVLDPWLQPVPTGVPGELHIGGVALARGYLNQPDLTAQRFIPDPFADRPGMKLYKTGDLVRQRSDGNLDFIGRLDHQVKILGVRVELGEIESVLAGHEAVHECVAVAREGGEEGAQLVAYVVPHAGHDAAIGQLRSFLAQRLPPAMVPAAIVPLEAIPLLPNGKLDRAALPVPDFSRRVVRSAYIGPATELERTIAAIWQDLLSAERIGIDDNFFDLGGNSLLMVQMQARLADALGRAIPIVDLFRYPSTGALARHLSSGDVESPALARAHERSRKQADALQRMSAARTEAAVRRSRG